MYIRDSAVIIIYIYCDSFWSFFKKIFFCVSFSSECVTVTATDHRLSISLPLNVTFLCVYSSFYAVSSIIWIKNRNSPLGLPLHRTEVVVWVEEGRGCTVQRPQFSSQLITRRRFVEVLRLAAKRNGKLAVRTKIKGKTNNLFGHACRQKKLSWEQDAFYRISSWLISEISWMPPRRVFLSSQNTNMIIFLSAQKTDRVLSQKNWPRGLLIPKSPP